MEVEVRKWGGSKAIIVPDVVADALGINLGDKVDVVINKKKKISGFGMFPNAKPFVRDEKALDREIL